MPRQRKRRVSPAKVNAAIRKAAHRGALKSALALVGVIVVKLSQPGSGRTYFRGKGRFHRASAPGEPPAADTGQLRGSIGHDDRSTPRKISIRVGTNLKKAVKLEFGDKRVAARPFMRPSAREWEARGKKLVMDELKKVRF